MCFEKLVIKITPSLEILCRNLNGHSLYLDEDDLFQEAILHLWIRYKNNELSDKNYSYIIQSCVFYLKNYLRKVRDKQIIMSLDMPLNEDKTTLGEIIPGSEPFLEESIDNKLFIETFTNKLAEREKRIISFCLEGLTVREIGQRLGISHVGVVKIKNRIKDKCEM